MIKVFEDNHIIMPFDLNNPGRNTEDFLIGKVGNVSSHDYQKFEKGKDSRIVYMPADKYIDECINNIFQSSYESVVTNAVDKDIVYKYMLDMKNGDIFPIPYLNYVNHQQEGRHRMLAFKLLNGENAEAPVLIIFKTEASEDEIRDYCKRRWGEADPYWVDYVKSKLGMIDEEDENENEDDNENDNLELLDDYEDDYEDDYDNIVKLLSKDTGMSIEEINDLSPIDFSHLIDKYL